MLLRFEGIVRGQQGAACAPTTQLRADLDQETEKDLYREQRLRKAEELVNDIAEKMSLVARQGALPPTWTRFRQIAGNSPSACDKQMQPPEPEKGLTTTHSLRTSGVTCQRSGTLQPKRYWLSPYRSYRHFP